MTLKLCTFLVLALAAFISFIFALVAGILYTIHQWQCDKGLVVIHVDFATRCVDPGLLLYNGTCDETWITERPPHFVRVENDATPYLFGVAVGVMVAALGFAYKTDPYFRRIT